MLPKVLPDVTVTPLISMGLVSHCPWVLQAAARFFTISSMVIVPSFIFSSETDLCVSLSIPLRYGIIQLTGKLDIAISIVNKVSLCDLGWKGRNECKCDSKKCEALIKHDWDIVSFELRRENKKGIKVCRKFDVLACWTQFSESEVVFIYSSKDKNRCGDK